MKVSIHKPTKKQISTFLGIAVVGLAVVYAVTSYLISYFSSNYELFATMIEIQVFALSYINVLGLTVIGMTTVLGIVLGIYYNRLIEE